MGASNLKHSILAVAETEPCVWFIELAFDEADQGHAVGGVYVTPAQEQEGDVPRLSLATNDGLSAIAASPTGSVWVGSVDGQVATTAAVSWPVAAGHVRYSSKDPAVPWSVTTLPRLRSERTPPNVSTIWALDDENVFAGTYLGHIYRWDGHAWTQLHEGLVPRGGTIRAFSGRNAKDVFAVGDNGVILHFDGSAWTPRTVPGEPNGAENFTGVATLADGQVIISGRGAQSRLIHGTSRGLTELTRTPLQLVSLVPLGERILFGAGEGVAELFGRDVRMIKSNFQALSAWPGRDRVFFIEPTQQVPAFIQHDPRNKDTPWSREKH